jgi:hypothetical protein
MENKDIAKETGKLRVKKAVESMMKVEDHEKALRQLVQNHQFEMRNIKTLARHHAMEFMLAQLAPIMENFKIEQ